MIILAIVISIFSLILLGFMVIALIMDITKTSDIALKDYYKRNNK